MKWSANYAGRYAVDPDALIGQFAGEDAGELRQSAFYYTVGCCAQTAAQAAADPSRMIAPPPCCAMCGAAARVR